MGVGYASARLARREGGMEGGMEEGWRRAEIELKKKGWGVGERVWVGEVYANIDPGSFLMINLCSCRKYF